METWKEINGYQNYCVSDLGNVMNSNGIVLKPRPLKSGYLRVSLCKNGNVKDKYIHRLVAEAFIENPLNKPQVNHLDENRRNNRLDNLEWVTNKENSNYGNHNARLSKRIIAYNDSGYYKEFESAVKAEKELGLWHQHIAHVLKGKRKTTGGYKFKYA